MFFGAENADMSIDGTSINQCIIDVLAESRAQSSDWAILLLGEKAYRWGVSSKYRNLYSKILKMRGEIKNLLENKISEVPFTKLTTYTNLFEALIFLKQQRN